MAGRRDVDEGRLRAVCAPRVQVDAVAAIRGDGGRACGATVELLPPTKVAQRPWPIRDAEDGGIVVRDHAVLLPLDLHHWDRLVA